MFEQLSGRMSKVFEGLSRGERLSEGDVTEAMREVRLAMLEADVALPVVRSFVSKVKERAVGGEVLDGVSPGQAVAKIVNDALIEALGGAGAVPLNLSAPAPIPYLLVGLQGAGKTTTAGKLALRLASRERKKVLLASLDVQRPAAQLQLQQIAEQVGGRTDGLVTSLPIEQGQGPVEIARRALDAGRREGFDIVILDTAGRLAIDKALMDEVRQVRDVAKPVETLLVVDAMTGQDAVNTAQSFKDQIGLTGVIMSRMDGDARGGAALSMKAVTGEPIKFTGSGEKMEALEEFHPERVAGRILGLGDVAGLVEKASEQLDQEEGERVAKRMLAGKFDLNDYVSQINQINRLGSISGILGMLPGMGKLKDKLAGKDLDTSIFNRHKAIISSMTAQERSAPEIIKASRKKRIALGSGTSVPEVNRLLKQFSEMSTMMKRLNKMGGLSGLMRGMGGAGGLGDMFKGMGGPGGRPPFG
ncbi:signal recognition particle protein [Parasaccharibacter sp. TMW 2.1888]|uniref:signal recognition particle protein n=1 Tax=Parasaccharibacter sp. TMW 2.1888 TaxID=2268025 RepID=UPI002065C01E|nr:signal recognition particle protein [Parasaccharibacter sp. TMW 2.1888]UPO79193.1 signal recognition particle protein [Parasaccharibacter sp. TMW 2.1888]